MSLPQIYVWFGLAQIALVGVLLLIDPHQARRVLGGENSDSPHQQLQQDGQQDDDSRGAASPRAD